MKVILNNKWQRKNISRLVLSIAIAAGVAQQANAGFVMMLDDLGDTAGPISINDLIGVLGSDVNPSAGAITYVGSIGTFNINVTTGTSKPAIGPDALLDLNSINVTGGAGGTLSIWLTDTGYTGGESSLLASLGGTTQGEVMFDFFHDVTNTEFGGALFATDSFISSNGNNAFSSDIISSVPSVVPYSLSVHALITHTEGGQATSFNAGITTVPLPGALALFSASLLSLNLIGKRRKLVHQ